MFWSDVIEKTIHRANLDGTNDIIFLDSSNGIGIVDGEIHLLIFKIDKFVNRLNCFINLLLGL